MHSEYARQREHLERSVASLRKKLSKDSDIHRGDTIRVMQVSTHRVQYCRGLVTREFRTSIFKGSSAKIKRLNLE